MTAKECAIDLIRVYVERGDSLESLVKGGLGCAGSDYCAHIGGFAPLPESDLKKGIWKTKRLRPDQVAVTEIKGVRCLHLFSIPKLYDEIKSGSVQQTLF